MIRSTNEKLGEYDLIRRPDHICTVWDAMKQTLPKYWEKFVENERRPDSVARLSAKFGKPVAPRVEPEADVLARVFDDAVASYEKKAEKYRRFFDPAALDEYRDDPNSFKHALAKDVPVIANTLLQRRAELKEWQAHFRGARANDLLEVFANVLDFRAEWSDTHLADGYGDLDEPAAFDLDPLNDDGSMSLANVIGMGIKSIVLYHLDPERLPPLNRSSVYALYFLSGRDHFGLPSQSSEFLMVDDKNPAFDGSLIMEHNFYYPYGLFSLYMLRVFRWIAHRASKIGYKVDRSVRYVYVERFFEEVCAQHSDDLKTMRALERFEVPA